MASITVSIRLGPLVHFEIEGDNCEEITAALNGFDNLNERLDAMCSDLAVRVYPEGAGEPGYPTAATQEAQS